MNKNERKHDLSKSSKIGSEDVGSFDNKMVKIYDQEFCPQTTRTITIIKYDSIGSIGLSSNWPKIKIHKSVRPTMFLRPYIF